MRPIIALATLAATATYVYSQRQRDDHWDGVRQPSPAPGGKPSNDPSSGFATFVAEGAVPRRGCPPSAPEPYPAAGSFGRQKAGHVDIYEYMAVGQQTFQQGVPDYCVDASEIQSGPRPGWVEKKSLADTLTLDRKGRVWWDYAREIDSVTSRLLNVGKTTLLVPTDAAIMSLSRKPHQNRDGETSDDEAEKNVERFIAAHVIPDFDGLKTDGPIKNLLGHEVEIVEDKSRGEGTFIAPGYFEVVKISEANNGRIFYINGMLLFRE